MAQLIEQPTIVEASGNKPKIIKEFFGIVNTKTSDVSIAQMDSPQGWIEPGQTPEFDEYTVVIQGTLHIKTKNKDFDVNAGQAVLIEKNQWVQYSSPHQGGAKYIAVCLPAFSINSVHRDEQ